jgi:hypothetical protein
MTLATKGTQKYIDQVSAGLIDDAEVLGAAVPQPKKRYVPNQSTCPGETSKQ